MSNIIDSIQVSGTVYQIQGSGGGGNNVIELTQAQYDALVDKDPTVFYIITDAPSVDMTNYYTKSETSGSTQISTALNAKADTATTYTKTEVDTALGGKQATLVSGTNIKTINNESILGSGNIDIQGGGGNVDTTFDRNSANAIANSAVTRNTIGNYYYGVATTSGKQYIQAYDQNGYGLSTLSIGFSKINNKDILSSYNNLSTLTANFDLVETSAFTTYTASTNSRLSEDEEVTAAALNALNDNFGGLKLVKLTQAEYDALTTKDSNTLYVIV